MLSRRASFFPYFSTSAIALNYFRQKRHFFEHDNYFRNKRHPA